MGKGELAVYQDEHGRPCPRVLLHPDNHEAWSLFGLGMNESLARFLGTCAGELLVEDLFTGMSRDEATAVAKRAFNAMQDDRVWKALHPDPKKPGAGGS